MIEYLANEMNNNLDWLSKLNPEQRAAVEETEGPLLVLSGAGTGKTRVLTSKIAYILYKGLARPWEILAVTFTNKAANEMKSRVRQIIGEAADSLWIGTFHSIGLRILKKHVELAGLKPNFLIFAEDDQRVLIKKVMEEDLKIDTKTWTPSMVLESVSRLKDKGFYFDSDIPLADVETINGRLFEIYKRYQERLRELNAVDFGDLLLYPLMILEKNPAVLHEFQQKFHYILVDEYQDTNAVQYKLLKLLSEGHRNIACVGDDDQSIYSWRGAEIENILRFEKDFKGAKIIRLETNYRSTPHILRAASHLIAHNRDRLGKELRPCENLADDPDSCKVFVRGVWNGEEEAHQIVDEIEYRQRKGVPLAEMAVLVRAGYQTRLFEERFIRAGIPYRIIGGLRFYERQEIKDIIAYLRLLLYPQDNLSFERIINVPRRGMGDKAISELNSLARVGRISMLDALKKAISTGLFKGKTAEAGRKFADDFDRWRSILGGTSADPADGKIADHSELVKRMLEESGYIDMWKNSKKVEAEAKLQNIMEFLGILKSDFESLAEFLEYIALFTESNEASMENSEYVSLMTLHAAKGLEFEVVFLPGWEMGIFPNDKTTQEGASGLEEERRLAYVGLTRAKKVALIYYAGSRQVFGQWQQNVPSVFLTELPNENVEHTSFSKAFG
ncbi:MAG: UvrD-helicase domain-containing protein [Rickettsiales bacterium]|jgi:DNA helicase-2/ATP-dependent DNA helicase PcrA|nr:UvrD-helicase domain-containing protein [Rickettsiales bacterium]